MVRRQQQKRSRQSNTRSRVKARYNFAAPQGGQDGGLQLGSTSSGVFKHHQVAGLVDPWSKHAKGSKIPDGDSAPSVPFTILQRNTYASDAAGMVGVGINPKLNELTKFATGITGTAITTWSAGATPADYSAYSGAFDKVRLVSYGVRIYSGAAPTEQSGSIKVITLPETAPNGFTHAGNLFEEIVVVPTSTTDLHWIGTSQGGYETYESLTSDLHFSRCVIVMENGPVSNASAIIVEITLNLEGLVNIGSVSTSLASPAAPHDPAVLAAQNLVVANKANAHTMPRQSFTSRMLGAAKDAMIEGASSMIPYVGPLIRRFLGGGGNRRQPMTIMDVD